MSYEVGARLGDYEVLQILGAGGMGCVYKVRNVISDRIEAMKVLLPDLEGNPDLANRFMREIKVQASLDHPNIAALHTALRINNQLLMLMEYVEGTTLESMIESGVVAIDRAIDYFAQVLLALSYAHGRGVVHRDLKPANVMITPEGMVKLMDFGIAKLTADRKLTQTGQTVGSLYYMSPEQIKGALDLDPRSDLYSVGVSLYEVVTGTRPFQGDSEYSIMAAHLQTIPPPPIEISPGLPPALSEMILVALEKDPARRFQTADAFRTALLSVYPVKQTAAAMAARGRGRQPTSSAPATASVRARELQPTPALPSASAAVTQPVPAATSAPAPVPQPTPALPSASDAVAKAAPVRRFRRTRRSYRALWTAVKFLVFVAMLVAAFTLLPQLRSRTAQNALRTAEEQGAAFARKVKDIISAVAGRPLAELLHHSTDSARQNPRADQARSATPGADARASSPVNESGTGQPASQNAPAPETSQNAIPLEQKPAASPEPTAAAPSRETLPQVTSQPTRQQEPAALEPQPAAAPAQTPAVDAKKAGLLNEMRGRHILLGVRVGTVKASLDSLRQQLASSGLGLRRDMADAAGRMDLYFAEADKAINRGNPQAAKKNLDLAEREVSKLEKFLGK